MSCKVFWSISTLLWLWRSGFYLTGLGVLSRALHSCSYIWESLAAQPFSLTPKLNQSAVPALPALN